jgi:hypothetical protein
MISVATCGAGSRKGWKRWMAESSPKMGNYYAPGDYAGFLLRFAILMIDLFIVLAVFIAVKVYHSLQPEEAHSMLSS